MTDPELEDSIDSAIFLAIMLVALMWWFS